MKLVSVTIEKYKSISNPSTFVVEPDITVLVGMNESGKTSILKSIAKTNYFETDEDFELNLTQDYPRAEMTKAKSLSDDLPWMKCSYSLDEEDIQRIIATFGDCIKNNVPLEISYLYDNPSGKKSTINIHSLIDSNIALECILKNNKIQNDTNEIDFKELLSKPYSEVAEKVRETLPAVFDRLEAIKTYFTKHTHWNNKLACYIYNEIIMPYIPKFVYYDEYYSLPSELNLSSLKLSKLEENQKTGKALIELAGLSLDTIINETDRESLIAELEATQSAITSELFDYWSTNKNLEIEFQVFKKINGNTRVENHYLDIRIKNTKYKVSLPLANRSKGFNWFFSFLVWFKKVQLDDKFKYIFLLDEPGLNLHAKAQEDLLRFMENLVQDNRFQIIYSTHSPFMIDSEKLNRVRTVEDSDKGTKVSDQILEKDPNTLFPLQAALGYNIAQNLFISTKNLLVEGVSELVYLQYFSTLCQLNGEEGLNDNITIVPVGGSDKIATFISLLRGQKLDTAVLLDDFRDQGSKARIDSLSQQNIIKSKNILFISNVLDREGTFDIEDLFDQIDYKNLIELTYKDKSFESFTFDPNQTVMKQVERHLKSKGVQNFNHYIPAKKLLSITDFQVSKTTMTNFSKLFSMINKLFTK